MSTATETYPELDAFASQARVLGSLLDELEPGELDRETRCPPMTVRDMIAHVAGALHVSTSLARDGADEKPTVDRGSWYRDAYDPETGAKIVERAQEEASKRSDEDLLDWCREELADAVEAFRGDPDGVVGRKGVLLTRRELAASRNVELGVHTMDLGHAAMRGERLTPGCAEVIADVLDRMLGESLPGGLGWSPQTYVLTGTGRRRLEPNERYTLGPLAERFPLIR